MAQTPETRTEFDSVREQLADALAAIGVECDELLARGAELGAELTTKTKQMRKAVSAGLEFLHAAAGIDQYLEPAEKSGGAEAGGEPSSAARHKFTHDFVNKVQLIRYRCEGLLKSDANSGGAQVGRANLLRIEAAFDEAYHAAREYASDRAAVTPPEPQTDPPQKTWTASTTAPQRTDAPGRVLVVEDDPNSREQLRERLADLGHEVLLASSGEEAIATLDGERVDLILLDLYMEGIDGLGVLDAVKSDYGLRSIPVVVISAENCVEAVAECISRGADDFLTKPFDTTLFNARVRSSLMQGRMRQTERKLHAQLQEAKQKADDLLYKIFPYTIAEELRTGDRVQPRGYDNVAVMFCDIVGFTKYCDGRTPFEVVGNLDELFSRFERAIEPHQVEKIKTIGDCFMVTAGLLRRFPNPVLSCLRAAVDLIEVAKNTGPGWDLRVGLHAGPVVAGMVGNKQISFDVWGDTVNTTQRVESAAPTGGIAVSEPAWAQAYSQCRGKSLGIQSFKGKGAMEVFLFEAFRDGASEPNASH